MKFVSWGLIAVLALVGVPAVADPPAPAVSHKPMTDRDLTDEQARSLASSEKVGWAIFNHDQAAWGSTDVLREKGIADKQIRGWVTMEDGDAITVLWIGDVEGELKLLYEMHMQGKQVVENSYHVYPGGKVLEPRQLAAFRARQTAGKSGFLACEGIYNSVVLPSAPGEPEGYDVFMLVAMPDWSRIKIGGNVLVRVDAAGTGVLETQYYTKSCLELDAQGAPEDSKAVAYTMSDILSETPTPIHVFLNLQHERPFYVLTTLNGIVWQVEGGRITPRERLEAPAP